MDLRAVPPDEWKDVRQGHWLDVSGFADGAFPEGAVVLSQSCDVVIPTRERVTIAPVVTLAAGELVEAKRGKQARLLPLPQLGDDKFAALDSSRSVLKADVSLDGAVPSVDPSNFEEVLDFSRGIARHYSRYAFPNDVVPWLKPLETTAAKKHDAPESPEGMALRQVLEFRVEEDTNWAESPYSITIHIILKPGQLPMSNESASPMTAAWLETDRLPSEIAQRLLAPRNPLSAGDRLALWEALAASWGRACKPTNRDVAQLPGCVDAVDGGAISVVLSDADDFTLTLHRRTVQLDVDYLSDAAESLGAGP